MFNANDFKLPPNPVISSLHEYDSGKLGILFKDGIIEKLPLKVGDSSPFIFKDMKWYESYEEGILKLEYPIWKILGYESSSEYREEERNESSTGWLLDYAKNKMPERWHKYLESKIRCW